ncbi:hypothetical protein [Haladaptatus salinisoli]|uniref:hypothetical protein n=1 Tax=Haladaptatus salinisoli TaxID=2884876 RepID=UPI001D0BAD7A|nr:hypothetical protein [Haladaptatus salinisoli]
MTQGTHVVATAATVTTTVTATTATVSVMPDLGHGDDQREAIATNCSETSIAVHDYYRRIEPAHAAIATLDGRPTLGLNDYYGWYIKRQHDDLDLHEQGFDQLGRVATLADDRETIYDRADRCVYAITSYKDPATIRTVPCRTDDGTTWQDDEKPTPDYGDIQGYAVWGDIDLASDSLKAQRDAGTLAPGKQETIEAALAAFAAEVGALYGGRDAVSMLDSVGGAYIFGPPAATLPIAEHFADDRDARRRVFAELRNRERDYLEVAEANVYESVDGANDLLDPDWVNNKNRQYKAPLSFHAEYDSVVTPIDTTDVQYDPTPVDAVSDELIAETAAWGEELTDPTYADRVGALVEGLWPEYTADHDDWRAALDAWVDDDRASDIPAGATPAGSTNHDNYDLSGHDPMATTADEITSDIRDIFVAIDTLDAERVAEKTIVHAWNDDAGTSAGHRAFVPIWGPDANGTANYINTTKGVWVDTGQNHHGTVVEMALIANEDWPRGHIADGADWWRGVDYLRALGFAIPEYNASESTTTDAVAATVTLPNSPRARADIPLALVDAATDAPTIDDIRACVAGELDTAMQGNDQVVIDAIMGSGKSYSTFKVARERDEPIAYLAKREGLYEQGTRYAEQVGFDPDDIYTLPSVFRDCPTFTGEFDDAIRDRAQKLYQHEVQPQTIHDLLDLPCEDGDAECPYRAKMAVELDDYQVIIGHHAHTHLPQVGQGRHVVFDEAGEDVFTTRLDGEALIRGVNAFLALHDSPPIDDWNDLLAVRTNAERRKRALAWFTRPEFDFEPDERNAVDFELMGYHAYAPLAVFTILNADPIAPGEPFERTSLPGINNAAQFFTTSEQNGTYHVEFQTPPELSYTKAVIGLDGTPLLVDDDPLEWERALGRPMNHVQILDDDERAAFLGETLANTYIQSTDAIKPYSSGRWTNPAHDAALCAAVRDQYGGGTPPVVFTSKKVRDQYEDHFTGDANLAKLMDHRGNLRGSDTYGDESLAVVLGSAHHGDHELRRRAAWLNETIDPVGKGTERDYGSAVGNAVLKQMREADTAQVALRVGRTANKPATVILDTAAIPDWFPIHATAHVDTRSAGEQSVFDATTDLLTRDGDGTTGVTTAAVAAHDAVTISERRVRQILTMFADTGHLARRTDPDDGRVTRWADIGLTDFDRNGTVDLPAIADGAGDTVAEESHIVLYTRDFRNFAWNQGTDTASSPSPGEPMGQTTLSTVLDGAPPPG